MLTKDCHVSLYALKPYSRALLILITMLEFRPSTKPKNPYVAFSKAFFSRPSRSAILPHAFLTSGFWLHFTRSMCCSTTPCVTFPSIPVIAAKSSKGGTSASFIWLESGVPRSNCFDGNLQPNRFADLGYMFAHDSTSPLTTLKA